MSASSKKKLRKEQYAEMMTERQKQAKSEAKKTKLLTASFIVVLVLIVAVFVGSIGMNMVNQSGIIEKNTVAATVGSHKLNSVVMNYFYIDAIQNEYNYAKEYAEYYTSMGMTVNAASMLGYDTTLSLSKQTNSTTGASWAQYYWDAALKNAQSVYAMYDKAVQDGFVLPQEYKDSIDQEISTMQLYASMYSTNVNGWISSIYGNGSTEQSYREYKTINYTASAYYQQHQNDKTFTDDERAAYLTAHPDDYTAYTYNYYSVSYQSFLPELAEGESYTEEQNNAAREEAKAAAATLAACTTVEELDAAIAALSYNEGKTVASTVSTDVMHTSTSLTDEQREWISAADRKAGDAKDFAVVTSTTNEDGTTTETTNSYKVMMYASTNEFSRKLSNVRHVLISFEDSHGEGEHKHETDSSGNVVYSDEDKAATKKIAEDLLQQWKDGGSSKDAFIELVKEHSADTASVEDGGLYEDIYCNASYEAAFLEWATDSARVAGDTGVVTTSYGCHIMYFEGYSELSDRDYMINEDLLSEHMTAWEEEIIKPVIVTAGKTNKIKFDLIVSQILN